MSESKSLNAAIAAALNEVEPISKDGKNTMQGYSFTSEANIAKGDIENADGPDIRKPG